MTAIYVDETLALADWPKRTKDWPLNKFPAFPKKATKYAEGQPRDDRGRFDFSAGGDSSGGGSGGGSSTSTSTAAASFGAGAVERLREPDSGYSLNPDGSDAVTQRYCVSIGGTEQVLAPGEVTPETIAAHFDAQAQTIADGHGANFYGGWKSPVNGSVYLDASTSFADRATAEAFGRTSGQLAIFDTAVGHSLEIPKMLGKAAEPGHSDAFRDLPIELQTQAWLAKLANGKKKSGS